MNSFISKLFRFGKKRDPVGGQSPIGAFTAIPGYLGRFLDSEYMYVAKDDGYYMHRDIYDMLLARACIDKIALECSKAEPMLDKPNERIGYFATKYPNSYQTMSQFIYQLVTVLLVENNVFIVPILDAFGRTDGFWIANPNQCEILDINGTLWLKYQIGDGKEQVIEYELCGHLRRMQNKSTLMGEDNTPFKKVASLYEKALDKSSDSLLANDSPLKWVGQVNVPLIDDEALREEQKRISDINLVGNKTGFFIYDSRYLRLDQIKNEMSLLTPDDIKQMENMAYNYWGVSEHLLQNSYTEDEWNGFYQSRIEPILIQIGEVLTRVIYTKNQIINGNALTMSSNRLQYASIKSRIDVAFGTYDRGMSTMDSSLDILNLPPLPNGEGTHRYIRGEYRAEGRKEGETNAKDESRENDSERSDIQSERRIKQEENR